MSCVVADCDVRMRRVVKESSKENVEPFQTKMTHFITQGTLTHCLFMHTHTTVLLLFWNMSGITRVSRYQKGKTRKGKTNLDLLEQETVSGSGICWAICKSAPQPR